VTQKRIDSVDIDRRLLWAGIKELDSDAFSIWLTLILTADESGIVLATPQEIARVAYVPKARAASALRRLQDPNSNSHSGDPQGRWVRPVKGGYQVVNLIQYIMRFHNGR